MKIHRTSLHLLTLAVALAATLTAHAAPVSTGFTFQGVLKDHNGVPINGSLDIRVTLCTALTDPPDSRLSQLWFNCEPVNNGLVSLKLNFPGIMFWDCEGRWLEFEVRPCNSTQGYQILTPRVEILPTPYALESLKACTVEPNGITTMSLQDSSVTAAKIASGAVVKSLNGLRDAVSLVAGANVTLTPNGNNIQISAAGGPSIWNLNGASTYYNGGNVGIGTLNPSKRLELQGPGDVEIGLKSTDDSYSRLWTLQSTHGLPGPGPRRPEFGSFQIIDRAASASRLSILDNGRVGIGTIEPSRNLEVQGAGDVEIGLRSIDEGGQLWTLQTKRVFPQLDPLDEGSFQIVDRTAGASRLSILRDGRVGIGTTEPYKNLQVEGPGDVEIGLKSTDSGGHLWTVQSSRIAGDPLDATFQIIDRTIGASRLTIDTGGDIYWGTSRLKLDQRGSIELGDSSANETVPYIDFHLGKNLPNPDSEDFNVRLINNADHQITVQGGSLGIENGDIHLSGGHSVFSAGRLHIQANEDLFLNPFGGARDVIIGGGGPDRHNLFVHGSASVCALEIRGGCDLAEPFQISDREIPKGSLVSIDEAHEGKLKLAETEYDTRVAGIVSGANGVNPGISLHQEGVIEGGQNVALSGRVYALADASNGSIKPGDLLTSSSTPGRVMKVTDHMRAQGAIVGKAMSALKEGKGLVLVLVSLQ